MEKTLIKHKAEVDITIVEGVKKLTGVTVTDVYQLTDEDGSFVRETRRQASEEELQLLLSAEVANITSANQELHTQNTQAQARITQLEGLLAQASAALDNVAAADAQWDTTPRAQVAAAIQAIQAAG